MKSFILNRLPSLIILAAVSLVSCVQDQIETSPSELATRSVDEKNADVDFLYDKHGGKVYFSVRKDRVIVKTASIDEAEKLSKQQDVFFTGEKAITVGR